MGWTKVETPRATYFVVHEIHLREPKFPLDLVDAVVLEFVSKNPVQEISGGYKKLFESLKNNPKPVFHGDVRKDVKPTMLLFFSPRALLTIPMLYKIHPAIFPLLMLSNASSISLVAGKEIKRRKKLIPFIGKINQLSEAIGVTHGGAIYRSALIAEKAEKVIAPTLQNRLNRKPSIAIVYGAGHAEIVELLQNPKRRRRILSSQKTSNKYHISEVIELGFNPKTNRLKTVEKSEIQLPKYRSASKRLKAHFKLFRQKTKRMMRRH